MITALTQETITPYASEAQTIQEPQGIDYTQGVRVGKTIPAKWWNWLFRSCTSRAGQSRSDAQNMLTELQNVVTDAGITLDEEDNTQLAQAVAQKAEAQISSYVSDRQGLLSLWGTMPIPGNLAEYNIVTDLQQSNGLYIMALRNFSNTKSCIAVSTDMQRWQKLYSYSSSMSYAFVSALAVVCFNGAYYVMASLGEHTEFNNIVVYKSTDLAVWDLVYGANDFTGSASAFLGTLSDGLYLIYKNYSTSNCVIRKLNSDGSAFIDTGLVYVDNSNDSVGNYKGNAYVFQIAMDKYLLGNQIIDLQNNTVTQLTTFDYSTNYFSSGLPSTVRGVTNITIGGTHTIKMLNGGYALLEVSLSSYRDTRVTLLDSTGAVTNSYVSSSAFYHFDIPNTVASYLFKKVVVGSAVVVQFSDDGITFTDMPYSDDSAYSVLGIIALNDGFYVQYANDSYAQHTLSLYKATVLSASISDYTLISQFDSNSALSLMFYGGIDDVLCLSSSSTAFVSLDKGVHWVQSAKIDGTSFIGKVNAVYNGICFSGLNYSENKINRVLGHTLYLR